MPSNKNAPSNKPQSLPLATPGSKEERKLVSIFGEHEGVLDILPTRKRATVIDSVLAYTDDGFVIHVPTGRNIPPPMRDGEPTMAIKNDRKFILHMLRADPQAWADSLKLAQRQLPTGDLAARLKATRDSYPGDDA